MVYKREKTSPDNLKRGFPRTTRPTCLIVCEGHTEEKYFDIVRRALTNVTIKKQTCPVELVNYAIEEIKDYDSVICVFDKESHPARMKKFEQAKTKLEKAAQKNKKTIIGAWSIPCFEVWSLCHLYYTTRPFKDKRDVEAELERQGFKAQDWRDDNKQQTAIINAKKLCDFHHDGHHDDNPSTRVHLAVAHLKGLLEA